MMPYTINTHLITGILVLMIVLPNFDSLARETFPKVSSLLVARIKTTCQLIAGHEFPAQGFPKLINCR